MVKLGVRVRAWDLKLRWDSSFEAALFGDRPSPSSTNAFYDVKPGHSGLTITPFAGDIADIKNFDYWSGL
jgi:hypothetical protein